MNRVTVAGEAPYDVLIGPGVQLQLGTVLAGTARAAVVHRRCPRGAGVHRAQMHLHAQADQLVVGRLAGDRHLLHRPPPLAPTAAAT